MSGIKQGPSEKQLQEIDWSKLPTPEDDGGAAHLAGQKIPSIQLTGTHHESIDLSSLSGLSIVFAYPMTGRPDVALPDNWDMIPGARGCTPQACSFRDTHNALKKAGVDHVFGLSTQATEYQSEAADRLHLPYPLLSDAGGEMHTALNLPVMEVEGTLLLKRLTLAVRDGEIGKVWYPVFPPDRSADDVLNWLT